MPVDAAGAAQIAALGRRGCLRPVDGGTGLREHRAETGDDRRLASASPLVREPLPRYLKALRTALSRQVKGRAGDERDRLIGRPKGRQNTKLHAVTDAKGRALRVFMMAAASRRCRQRLSRNRSETATAQQPCWAASQLRNGFGPFLMVHEQTIAGQRTGTMTPTDSSKS